VHLFFAISGILICLRLLEEGALHGGFQPRLPYKRPGSGSVW
jgi:peptidoglycan/LPS O-acetylase OafA/YrhL